MLKDQLQLELLRLLNDAPQQLFTTAQLHGDLNASEAARHESFTQRQVADALDDLASLIPAQVERVAIDGKMHTKIAGAGILRVLRNPRS